MTESICCLLVCVDLHKSNNELQIHRCCVKLGGKVFSANNRRGNQRQYLDKYCEFDNISMLLQHLRLWLCDTMVKIRPLKFTSAFANKNFAAQDP